MNAGKTVAATELVRGLARSGVRVAAVKLTGVSLMRDTLSMLDAGAAPRSRSMTRASRARIRGRPSRSRADCSTSWPRIAPFARSDRGRARRWHPGRVRRAGHPARSRSLRARRRMDHRRARPGRLLGREGAVRAPLQARRSPRSPARRPTTKSAGTTSAGRLASRPTTRCAMRPDGASRRRAPRCSRGRIGTGGARESGRDRRRRICRRRAAAVAWHPSGCARMDRDQPEPGRASRWGYPPPGRGILGRPLQRREPAEAAAGRDVVFLCLEHGESSKLAAEVFEGGAGLVVDLAADFRIQDPGCTPAYYGAHPAPDLVHRFTYGLADVLGRRSAARRPSRLPDVSRPRPSSRSTRCVASTRGAAGALRGDRIEWGRRAPKPTTHHPMRAHNLFAYSVFGHRHEGEVLEQWRAWTGRPGAEARLLTHSGPFVRGIHLTLHAHARRRPRAARRQGGGPVRHRVRGTSLCPPHGRCRRSSPTRSGPTWPSSMRPRARTGARCRCSR